MRPPLVLKFGGAALADGASVQRACELVAARAPERPIVVVSAAWGVTDRLIEVAEAAVRGEDRVEALRSRHRVLLRQLELPAQLLDRQLEELALVLAGVRRFGVLAPAVLDHVLSFGERMSARFVAAALRARGVTATPVDACDAGMLSDSRHGAARPLPGSGEALRRHLAAVRGVPVVTGFLARDAAGSLTTLGRNGSDLSASLIGAAVGAREVWFYKLEGGVLDADPALVPDARDLPRLSWSQAAEYARRGARVLHPDCLAPLEAAGIEARVLGVRSPNEPGTCIGPGPSCADAAEPIGLACWLPTTGGTGDAVPAVELALVGFGADAAPRVEAVLAAAGLAALHPPRAEASGSLVVRVPAGSEVAAARALHGALLKREPRPVRAAV